MTRYGEIPDHVLKNAEQRLGVAIRYRTRTCVYDECDAPASHWPATSSPTCETHRTRPRSPVSDPARRLYALRDKAIAARAQHEEEQLLTIRIAYTWASQAREETAV